MWNYLFFFIHLRTKAHTELTWHEQYVLELLQRDEVAFFPVGDALCFHDNFHKPQV